MGQYLPSEVAATGHTSKPMDEWSPAELVQWLRRLPMLPLAEREGTASAFRRLCVTGELFCQLNGEALRSFLASELEGVVDLAATATQLICAREVAQAMHVLGGKPMAEWSCTELVQWLRGASVVSPGVRVQVASALQRLQVSGELLCQLTCEQLKYFLMDVPERTTAAAQLIRAQEAAQGLWRMSYDDAAAYPFTGRCGRSQNCGKHRVHAPPPPGTADDDKGAEAEWDAAAHAITMAPQVQAPHPRPRPADVIDLTAESESESEVEVEKESRAVAVRLTSTGEAPAAAAASRTGVGSAEEVASFLTFLSACLHLMAMLDTMVALALTALICQTVHTNTKRHAEAGCAQPQTTRVHRSTSELAPRRSKRPRAGGYRPLSNLDEQKRQARDQHERLSGDLEVRNCGLGKGKGLFAMQDLPPGYQVYYYGCFYQDNDAVTAANLEDTQYVISNGGSSRSCHVDGLAVPVQYAIRANHAPSYSANAQLLWDDDSGEFGQPYLELTVPVKKGAEITVDYGPHYDYAGNGFQREG
eukprot:COSAG01_NODE_1793_length_9215_cov_16.655002_10_plen_531_part_00